MKIDYTISVPATITLIIMWTGILLGWWKKLGILSNVLFPGEKWKKIPVKNRWLIAKKMLKD